MEEYLTNNWKFNLFNSQYSAWIKTVACLLLTLESIFSFSALFAFTGFTVMFLSIHSSNIVNHDGIDFHLFFDIQRFIF